MINNRPPLLLVWRKVRLLMFLSQSDTLVCPKLMELSRRARSAKNLSKFLRQSNQLNHLEKYLSGKAFQNHQEEKALSHYNMSFIVPTLHV